MRDRVLHLAAKLVSGDASQSSEFEEMELRLKHFYALSAFKEKEAGRSLKPPLSLKQAARDLLANSQAISMATIDACLLKWISIYSAEISDFREFSSKPMKVGDALEQKDLEQRAWSLTLTELASRDQGLLKELQGTPVFLERGYLGLQEKINSLSKQAPWHPSESASLKWLRIWSIPEVLSSFVDYRDDWYHLGEILSDKARESLDKALSQNDVFEIYRCGLVNRDHRLSGRYLREKKRAEYTALVTRLEGFLQSSAEKRSLEQLNQTGIALARLFSLFSFKLWQLKKTSGVLSFSDLAPMAKLLLTSEEAVGAQYRLLRQTKHLLIDEFQDTSFDQWEVFFPICRELLSGQGLYSDDPCGPPTVFLVGDPKQSIYGFRNANPEIMRLASEQLSDFGLQEISMSESYRSAQGIMDFCNFVFPKLLGAHFPHHQTATRDGQSVHPGPSHIRVVEYDPPLEGKRLEHEADRVASDLRAFLSEQEIWDSRLLKLRRARAGDVAILFRNSTHMRLYDDALRRQGLRAQVQSQVKFLDEPLVADYLQASHVLHFPKDKHSLASLALSPFVGVSPSDFFPKLNSEFSCEDYLRLIESLCTPKQLHRWQEILRLSKESSLLSEKLQKLHDLCPRRDLMQTIEGQLEHERSTRLFTLLSERVSVLESQGCLTFGDILDRLKKDPPSLELSQSQEEAVTLMSIHKSKGLEFPFVILVDAATKWEKRDLHWLRVQDYDQPFWSYVGGSGEQLPSGLSPVWDSLFEQFDDQQSKESQRLLYVALTRAKQYLWIVGTRFSEDHYRAGALLPYLFTLAEQAGLIPHKGATFRNLDFKQEAALLLQGQDDRPQTLSKAPFSWAARQPPPGIPRGLKLANAQVKAVLKKAQARTPSEIDQRLFGLTVHKALENYVSKGECDIERSAFSVCRDLLSRRQVTSFFLEKAQQHVQAVLASEKWQDLCRNAVALHCELRLSHLEESTLTIGQVDLLIDQGDHGLTLLDYKTGTEEGIDVYFEQLQVYLNLLKAVHPEKSQITSYLVLTDTGSFIEGPSWKSSK